MSKSILQSIKPRHCELIASEKKKIEVRKTRPKLHPPFKVYVYETAGRYKTSFETTNPCISVPNGGKIKPIQNGYRVEYFARGTGKVIGEYMCDRIDTYEIVSSKLGSDFVEYKMNFEQLSNTCLSINGFCRYGKGKTLYGWHISDLKIYDKPKELSEFIRPCDKDVICTNCDYAREDLTVGEAVDWILSNHSLKSAICINKLTRPPQSWCYVEEVIA